MMKILTWNINGIRAVTGKAGVGKLLKTLDSDIVCLQETKVTRDMLDEPTAIVEGYESYFSFSRKRTGYSGTANYCCKHCRPVRAEEGLTGILNTDTETSIGCYGNFSAYSEKDLEALDAEGRCVITQHKLRMRDGSVKEVAIINVYVPRAGDRPERLNYKLRFLTLLRSRAQALLKHGVHVIILGDLNLTHTAKDNCDPNSDADFLRRASRIWMNNLLQPSERDKMAQSHPDLEAVALSEDAKGEETDDDSDEDGAEGKMTEAHKVQSKELKGGKIKGKNNGTSCRPAQVNFSDVYRRLHPEETAGYTNWDTSTDARKSNYGRRLDYILVDTGLADHVTECRILAEVEGSDHCPVVVTLDCHPLPCPTATPPLLCSKLMPEFRGQQQKLSSFFTKTVLSGQAESNPLSSSHEDRSVVAAADSHPQLKKSSSVPAACSSSQEKLNLKRCVSSRGGGPTRSGAPPQKRAKKAEQKGARQASLASFFALKPSNSTSSSVSSSQNSGCEKSEQKVEETSVMLNEDVICVDDQLCAETAPLAKTLPSQADDKVCAAAAVVSEPDRPGRSSGLSDQTTTASAPVVKTISSSVQSWKSLLSGPAPPPLCPGHQEPCVLKTVRKNGPNKNKQFYTCPRPDGPPGNSQYRCNFFQWLNDRQKKKT